MAISSKLPSGVPIRPTSSKARHERLVAIRWAVYTGFSKNLALDTH